MNWEPFEIAAGYPLPPRPITETAGVGDRLRSAAFAELQAIRCFHWAAERFESSAPEELIEAWKFLATQEENHMNWLLGRMKELGIAVNERTVSDSIWRSLTKCETAESFCLIMADAEWRGQRAGYRFHEKLISTDEKSAKIFHKIAEEETGHIQVAFDFFPESAKAHLYDSSRLLKATSLTSSTAQ